MAAAGGNSLSAVLTKASDEAIVEYFLFPEETSIAEGTVKLNELLMELNIEAVSIVGEYMWQKDSFHLKLDESGNYFYGTIQYDVNVEDEWFTVYILQQLTRKFSGLIARVVDQDGEFLLIESSDYLPKWAESDEICQQRVYISNGLVHLISEIEVNGKLEASPSKGDLLEISLALELIRKHPNQTLANEKIQVAISKRIGKYPEKMLQNFHHSNLYLPPQVAQLLKSRPNLVSASIRAFHYRDGIDMKTARLMAHFSPISHLVKKGVRFTKSLYAMLSSQEFYPDSKTNWKFPLRNSPEYKANALGAKLTLGFEIILSRGRRVVSSPVSFSSSWLRYEEKLKQYNYYKDFIEGSREYKKLEEQAKLYFQATVASELDTNVDDQAIQDVQSLIDQSMDLTTIEDENLSLPEDDDDSWLDVNADELESLLEAQFKTKISDQKLDQIPEKLKEFMTQMSDYTGVEVPTDGSEHESGDEDGGLDPLDFRADDFVSAMDNLLLELGKPNKDWDLSEPSSEEDEDDINMKEIKEKYSFSKDSKIHELMGAMDEELDSTEIGKTFQFTSTGLPITPRDRVTSTTTQLTETVSSSSTNHTVSYEPVDIDMNALANMLESFQSQENPTGPSSNLLRNIGFDITKAKK